MATRDRLGRVGVWSPAWSAAFRSGDQNLVGAVLDGAAELEELGYHTLWIGQSASARYAEPLLEATRRVRIATGIVSIWDHDPVSVACQRSELEHRHRGRFMLGLGVSHGEFNARYDRPYAAMDRYLSGLDSASEPVPASGRVLAALGPKMLALARSRVAGAHPYLVTVRQVAQARDILGPDAVLAPELTVVVDEDPARARTIARSFLTGYLAMRNYTASLARDGFTQEDFRAGGSDRLVDALVAAGPADSIAARITALHQVGADHVAVQAVIPVRHALPLSELRQLAAALHLKPDQQCEAAV